MAVLLLLVCGGRWFVAAARNKPYRIFANDKGRLKISFSDGLYDYCDMRGLLNFLLRRRSISHRF